MTERLEPCPERCTCGSQDFMFCKDFTSYSPMVWDDEKKGWTASYAHQEDDAERCFCQACGKYYLPPDLL